MKSNHLILSALSVLSMSFIQGCVQPEGIHEWPSDAFDSNEASGTQALGDSRTQDHVDASSDEAKASSVVACVDGTKRACELPGLGDCSLGFQICETGRYGACEPRFEKGPEICGLQSDGFEQELGPALGDEDCDGRFDESDLEEPSPQGCEHWMRDADADGFGAVGSDVAVGDGNPTWGCLCAGPAHVDWAKAEKDQLNTDCGDCREDGARIFPGSQHYLSAPSRCLESLGYPFVYDADCSKSHEPEYPKSFTCKQTGPNECRNDGHWRGTPPACGEMGEIFDHERCAYAKSEGGCVVIPTPPDEERVQTCR